jgi:Uma2 family endonuclease
MVQATTSHMTPDEFLAWEREQRDERHHYVRGDIFAMSGGSARHSYLGAQMIGPCVKASSEARATPSARTFASGWRRTSSSTRTHSSSVDR